MNEVSAYMDHVSEFGGRGEEEFITELYISSLCTKFSNKCTCIILIVNLPPE